MLCCNRSVEVIKEGKKKREFKKDFKVRVWKWWCKVCKVHAALKDVVVSVVFGWEVWTSTKI